MDLMSTPESIILKQDMITRGNPEILGIITREPPFSHPLYGVKCSVNLAIDLSLINFGAMRDKTRPGRSSAREWSAVE